MGWMQFFIWAFNDLLAFFYDLYREAFDWVYPFNRVAYIFYLMAQTCSDIAWAFYNFSNWIDYVEEELPRILSWATIRGYILLYFPGIDQVVTWFANWINYVQGVINDWWFAAQQLVQAWISAAVSGFQALIDDLRQDFTEFVGLINNLIGQLPDLTAILDWFSDWWGNVLVNLGDWWNDRLVDIQDLINTAFTIRASLWEGWQEWRDNVVEFFTDPVEYIWQRVTDWFLGPG